MLDNYQKQGNNILYEQTPSDIHSERRNFFSARKVVYYSDITDPVVSVNESNYYVPLKLVDPLFDAFFFHGQDASTIIWILQVTTAERPGLGSASVCFNAVRSLRDIAERTRKSVQVEYLLVSQRDRRVIWKMPTSWDDKNVKGDVFVQYLDI